MRSRVYWSNLKALRTRAGAPTAKQICSCWSPNFQISTIAHGCTLNAHGLKFHIAVFGWLVALTILKQYESQWEGWHPIYYGKIIFHTTNQLGVNKSASCSTMPLIFSTPWWFNWFNQQFQWFNLNVLRFNEFNARFLLLYPIPTVRAQLTVIYIYIYGMK